MEKKSQNASLKDVHERGKRQDFHILWRKHLGSDYMEGSLIG